MNIAIIPARGGSKRIPRKNIKPFCGKPMLAWSIETALQSGCFDQVIVSTDDQEIAKVAQQYGAEIPFIRPPELSDDHTGTIPVIAHAIQTIQQAGFSPDYACCIYATAPFITVDALKSGFDLLNNSHVDYVFSVTSYPYPIQRAIRIRSDQTLEMFQPEQFNARSQDLDDAYHDAGQFYWGKISAWLTNKIIFSNQSLPVILPRYLVQDIDTLEDWIRAELMFKSIEKSD